MAGEEGDERGHGAADERRTATGERRTSGGQAAQAAHDHCLPLGRAAESAAARGGASRRTSVHLLQNQHKAVGGSGGVPSRSTMKRSACCVSCCWMTSIKQSSAVTGQPGRHQKREAGVMQPRSGRFSELVERVSGPECQPHGDAAEKNIARGTRKRYIRSIQLNEVLNEVQQKFDALIKIQGQSKSFLKILQHFGVTGPDRSFTISHYVISESCHTKKRKR